MSPEARALIAQVLDSCRSQIADTQDAINMAQRELARLKQTREELMDRACALSGDLNGSYIQRRHALD